MTEPDADKSAIAARLREHLESVSRIRLARLDAPGRADYRRLKAWQTQRLAATHADLLDDPRYAPAARFFLEELYGSHDFTVRDAEVARILPTLVTVLPANALNILAEAIELDALSESLDEDMVGVLRRLGKIEAVDAESYRAAYRACGRKPDRERQIALINDVGQALEKVTRKPLLATTLKLMRRPAHAAGLADLHRFLDVGFHAFRHMGSAAEFVGRIRERETAFMAGLFSGPD